MGVITEANIMVRAKFRVNGIFGGTVDGVESKRIEMSPVFASETGREGNACEENAIFGKWTPSGSISITIVNPAAFEQFEVNKEYYVDFSSMEECQDKAEETESEEVEEEKVEEEKSEGQDEEVKTEETGEDKLSNPESEQVGEAAARSVEGNETGEKVEGQPEGQETASEGQESSETTGDPKTIAEGEATGEANPAQSVE